MNQRKLYQLPEGSWIHPEEVREIEVMPAVEEYAIPPRVAVRCRNGNNYINNCETLEGAKALRDLLAQWFNYRPIQP